MSVRERDLKFAARDQALLYLLWVPAASPAEPAAEPSSPAAVAQPERRSSGCWMVAAVAARVVGPPVVEPAVVADIDRAEQPVAVAPASVDKSADTVVEQLADEQRPEGAGKLVVPPGTEAVRPAEVHSIVVVDVGAAVPGIEQPVDSGSCMVLVVAGTAGLAVATAAAKQPDIASESAVPKSSQRNTASSHR